MSFTIVAQKGHNEKSFTQGLAFHKGALFESSGLYGESFIEKYSPESNVLIQHRQVNDQYFAEGLTVMHDQGYLLTWKSKVVLIFNPETLETTGSVAFHGEAWGLTHNYIHLIASNGSNRLEFIDAESMTVDYSIYAEDSDRPIANLNELEYAKGFIWANVWKESLILKIDPRSGNVVGSLSLHELTELNGKDKNRDVLNGIAYDQKHDAFWITGKYWKRRYLLRIHD